MQDMYTFFPPLTVLPHGKVLYLYPADRAALAYGGRTPPPIAPHHLTSRTSPPNTPFSHTGRIWTRQTLCPRVQAASEPAMRPQRHEIPRHDFLFSVVEIQQIGPKNGCTSAKNRTRNKFIPDKMQTSVCPKITSRADARNRRKDPAEAGSFYGFFVFPELMPEIFFPQGAPL